MDLFLTVTNSLKSSTQVPKASGKPPFSLTGGIFLLCPQPYLKGTDVNMKL